MLYTHWSLPYLYTHLFFFLVCDIIFIGFYLMMKRKNSTSKTRRRRRKISSNTHGWRRIALWPVLIWTSWREQLASGQKVVKKTLNSFSCSYFSEFYVPSRFVRENPLLCSFEFTQTSDPEFLCVSWVCHVCSFKTERIRVWALQSHWALASWVLFYRSFKAIEHDIFLLKTEKNDPTNWKWSNALHELIMNKVANLNN